MAIIKDVLDFDPFTRTTTYHHYNTDTDETTIEEVQDVSAYLEIAKSFRNDSDYTRKGMKEEMWHYAIIPNVVQTQLLRRGIDIYNKDQTAEVMRIINTEYPWLKTTTGHHA